MKLKHWICNCEDGGIYSEDVKECPLCNTKRHKVFNKKDKNNCEICHKPIRGKRFCITCLRKYQHSNKKPPRFCLDCGQQLKGFYAERCIKCSNQRITLQRRASEIRVKKAKTNPPRT